MSPFSALWLALSFQLPPLKVLKRVSHALWGGDKSENIFQEHLCALQLLMGIQSSGSG